MEDLRNRELVKVLWLGEEEILFDIKTDNTIPMASDLYAHLLHYIDIAKWRERYTVQYQSWLNQDDNSIYDINYKVNIEMINALAAANEALTDKAFLYWFDVDRTLNADFIWEFCPLSGKRLMPLDGSDSQVSLLISPDYPLIFTNWFKTK